MKSIEKDSKELNQELQFVLPYKNEFEDGSKLIVDEDGSITLTEAQSKYKTL